MIKKLNESSIETNNSIYNSIRFTGRKDLESDLSIVANTAQGPRKVNDYSPDPLCESSLLQVNESTVRTSSIRERSKLRKSNNESINKPKKVKTQRL